MINEVIITNEKTGGQKGSKIERFDLIPWEALVELAAIYGFGAEKYEAHNWRKGYDWGLSYASLIRHASAFWSGEDIDPESGMPHMAHAAWHCMTLLTFMREQPDLDDRFKPKPSASPALINALTSIALGPHGELECSSGYCGWSPEGDPHTCPEGDTT